jgi:hypothetical protein
MFISIPPLSYWYSIGVVDGINVIYGCTAAASTLGVLAGLSYVFRRLLGEISYCEKSRTVSLSHLNFMGKRCNIEVDVEKVVPYYDTQSLSSIGLHRYLQRLELTDYNNLSYYYSLRYGMIMDHELLKKILKM